MGRRELPHPCPCDPKPGLPRWELLTPLLGTSCRPGCRGRGRPRGFCWEQHPWGDYIRRSERLCLEWGAVGKNSLCNDMWSELMLLTVLKEYDTHSPALNYFLSFVAIASPSPEMQQLFATAQCLGAGGKGGSCKRGVKGTVGRENAAIHGGI